MQVTPNIRGSAFAEQLQDTSSQSPTFAEKTALSRRFEVSRNQHLLFSGQMFFGSVTAPQQDESRQGSKEARLAPLRRRVRARIQLNSPLARVLVHEIMLLLMSFSRTGVCGEYVGEHHTHHVYCARRKHSCSLRTCLGNFFRSKSFDPQISICYQNLHAWKLLCPCRCPSYLILIKQLAPKQFPSFYSSLLMPLLWQVSIGRNVTSSSKFCVTSTPILTTIFGIRYGCKSSCKCCTVSWVGRKLCFESKQTANCCIQVWKLAPQQC